MSKRTNLGSGDNKRYSLFTSNPKVKEWLDAQLNRSASIELLIRMFINTTGRTDEDIFESVLKNSSFRFNGMETNYDPTNEMMNEAATYSHENSAPSSANHDKQFYADHELDDDDNAEEDIPVSKVEKPSKPRVKAKNVSKSKKKDSETTPEVKGGDFFS